MKMPTCRKGCFKVKLRLFAFEKLPQIDETSTYSKRPKTERPNFKLC